MPKPISREPFPPPRSGRRIPPIAATKTDNGEDRPNARDLLATVNSASEGAAATWLAFLGMMAYLAVTLGGVTHVDLLLNNDTTLPFVNVKVPLATFFVMAPLAFVLVHFSLLLQHVMLSRKLAAFEQRLTKEEPSRDRDTQNIRDELHSFTFTQVASGKPKGAVVDMAQRLVISLTLVVFPMLLLTFFQIGFLAYHSEPITWWHRGMLALDVAVVWCLARHLVRVDPASKIRLTDWWHGTSRTKCRLIISWRRMLDWTRSAPDGSTSTAASLARTLSFETRRGGTFVIRAITPTRVVIVVLMLFSLCVATLPHSPDTLVPLDKWMASIPLSSAPVPFCQPLKETPDGQEEMTKCPEVTKATRRAFYPTAYLFERKVEQKTGKSDSLLGWSRNLIVTDKTLVEDEKKEARLNLRGRDFRYATLDRSHLERADFFGANLEGASLEIAHLNAAVFEKANLRSADLNGARLEGASFLKANLEAINLDFARVRGANLSWSSMQGANLRQAKLDGTNLSGAEMWGADASGAFMRGADLSRAKLQGANLEGARLQGADLSDANLQAANLSLANLLGATLSGTRLQGASFESADLRGAEVPGARIWRTRPPSNGNFIPSHSELRAHPLEWRERQDLHKTSAILKELRVRPSTDGEEAAYQRASNLRASIRRLVLSVVTADERKWIGGDRRTWCWLARKDPPDLEQLARNLGELFCEDDSKEARMATRFAWRIILLGAAPQAFLEASKGCPAHNHLSALTKLRLSLAGTKFSQNQGRSERPGAPEHPAICSTL